MSIHLRLLPGVHSAFRFSDAISPGLFECFYEKVVKIKADVAAILD